VNLGELGFREGGRLLVKRALGELPVGGKLEVASRCPDADVELRAWARGEGHGFRIVADGSFSLERGGAEAGRWQGAERAGLPDPRAPGAVSDSPPGRWGLAARGALVESGVPDFRFRLADRSVVWAEEAPRLYRNAVAAQWDPNAAIRWDEVPGLPGEVEQAVVQVMTYLIENETAALIVPSRFVAELHPHFREVMQLLAVQAADEARHIEVFTRRATMTGQPLGLSTVGGQVSLRTLLDEPDFAMASFLLSVMGEGSFLTLLRFLEQHAPDSVTRAVTGLAAQDESRHVAFAVAHLRESVRRDPGLLEGLALAVRRRHDALRQTTGLNAEVLDALVLLAARSWAPAALREGSRRVDALVAAMDRDRQAHLRQIGFDPADAAELSGLHTRNFM
jgi:hypothetical protein